MLESLPLVSGPLPALALAAAIGAVLGTLAWRRRTVLRRQLLIGVPIALGATAALALVASGLGAASLGIPPSCYAGAGLILLALALGVVGWRRLGAGQRAVAVIAVVLTTLSAGLQLNLQFQYLPTVGALFGVDSQHETTERALDKLRGAGAGDAGLGYTVQIAIPGTTSKFRARDAYVWLPPEWFSHPAVKLPVIEMLAGVPGGPVDWTRSGAADQTAQAFAGAHGGVAPILVMPDATGAETVDTECVNSALGNAETYLTADVPEFVEKRFGAAAGAASWAVAGLSAGGACAIMLALRHPDRYSAFADYSGLEGPTVGDTMEPAQTTQQLFGGSTAEYDAHQPAMLLREGSFPGMGGWFETGAADPGPLAAQRELAPLASSAGISTCTAVIPNAGHSFGTWTEAFRDSLPWLAGRLRLTAEPSSTAPAMCA
ncbi:alpha/beta hydrolase [Gryllotalpicola protaetiae]|uniref:Esterase n=1 Tax=Gryllotalpicola protaetiae TaxID=2419771 RepID=A0A387BRS4_9MICO|nr:alpha/beta hydrolase-fold protein [Gryllotalpicola protaetiae]AYG03759.1 hypothetical protein D7I44_09570 [Gryllotalpicola protaetiae]